MVHYCDDPFGTNSSISLNNWDATLKGNGEACAMHSECKSKNCEYVGYIHMQSLCHTL